VESADLVTADSDPEQLPPSLSAVRCRHHGSTGQSSMAGAQSMTNLIEFAIDVQGRDSVASLLSGIQQQVPYAMMVAINRTAEEVLAEARREIRSGFIVRSPKFDLPPTQLPRTWRATKTRPIATVDLGDDDGGKAGIGSRRRQIFSKFELGGTKHAIDSDFPIAIPTRAIRPSPSQLVPKALYPVNLRLTPRTQADGSILPALRRGKVRTLSGAAISNRARRQQQLVGVGGTFVIYDASGKPIGVFQRTGPGHRNIRLIWAYRQSIHIPKLMDFAARGSAIISERFGPNFDGALALAVATAR
jgi:hypothetical protein